MNSSMELTSKSSENTPLLGDSPEEPVNENVKKFPRQSIFTCAVVCILCTELCERLTFYGISGNLVLFATEDEHLGMSPSQASILAYVFTGIHVIMSSNLSCLICERHLNYHHHHHYHYHNHYRYHNHHHHYHYHNHCHDITITTSSL